MRSLAVLGHDDLLVDAFLQLVDMGDDSDKALSVGELLQESDGAMEGVFVERPEAFVDEHGFQSDAAAHLLDDIA